MSTDTETDQSDWQAVCEQCEWYGHVRLVEPAAARDAQAHDVDEHGGECPTSEVREVAP